MRFEVLKTASINIRVAWNVMLCSQVNRYKYFGRPCCLHLLGVSGTCLHYMASQPTSTVTSMNTLLRQTTQDLKMFCEPPTSHRRILHPGVLCLLLQCKWLLTRVNKISYAFPWHTLYFSIRLHHHYKCLKIMNANIFPTAGTYSQSTVMCSHNCNCLQLLYWTVHNRKPAKWNLAKILSLQCRGKQTPSLS